jgi:hypothetical protein
MKKYIAAALIALPMSMNAFAWGDKEQGILIGIGSAIVGSKIIGAHQQRQQPQVIVIQDSELADAYLNGVRDGYNSKINREVEEILARERRMKYRVYACGVSVHNCDRVTSID